MQLLTKDRIFFNDSRWRNCSFLEKLSMCIILYYTVPGSLTIVFVMCIIDKKENRYRHQWWWFWLKGIARLSFHVRQLNCCNNNNNRHKRVLSLIAASAVMIQTCQKRRYKTISIIMMYPCKHLENSLTITLLLMYICIGDKWTSITNKQF